MSVDELAAAFPFRLRQLETAVDKLKDWRSKVDVDRATQIEQIKTIEERVVDLTSAVDSLRKTVVGFALTVAGSAIVFAFSTLFATGKI